MSDPAKQIATAVSLMRMALALLDRAGEAHGAVFLQTAIDKTTRAPVPRTEADIPSDLIERFERGQLP